MDNIDEESAIAIYNLQLQDLADIGRQDDEHGLERSDTDIAVEFYRNELQQVTRSLRDYRISIAFNESYHDNLQEEVVESIDMRAPETLARELPVDSHFTSVSPSDVSTEPNLNNVGEQMVESTIDDSVDADSSESNSTSSDDLQRDKPDGPTTHILPDPNLLTDNNLQTEGSADPDAAVASPKNDEPIDAVAKQNFATSAGVDGRLADVATKTRVDLCHKLKL
ncbi:MAG: hypothetical protein Q9219_002441 [cf. Caloplaca sp. 3 TL-2023]